MSTKVVELKTVKVGKYIVLDGEASKVTLKLKYLFLIKESVKF